MFSTQTSENNRPNKICPNQTKRKSTVMYLMCAPASQTGIENPLPLLHQYQDKGSKSHQSAPCWACATAWRLTGSKSTRSMSQCYRWCKISGMKIMPFEYVLQTLYQFQYQRPKFLYLSLTLNPGLTSWFKNVEGLPKFLRLYLNVTRWLDP